MNYLIIDNKATELNELLRFLNRIDDGRVLPGPNAVCESWAAASDLISKHAENNQEQIIFLDLALDTNNVVDARGGLLQAESLRELKPDAIWIAYTMFQQTLQRAKYEQIFSSVLDKQDWSQQTDGTSKLSFLKRVIAAARRKKSGSRNMGVITEDSLGFRNYLAAFPDTLDDLILNVCPGWSGVSVRALSAGYSGASLLLITGTKDSAAVRIVVKIAPTISILEREATVLEEFRDQKGHFAVMMADSSKPAPLGAVGFFIKQEVVPGETLATVLNRTGKNMNHLALTSVIQLELAQYGGARLGLAKQTAERFSLVGIDLHRARHSTATLENLAQALFDRKEWPETIPNPVELFKSFNQVLESWQDLMKKLPPLFWVFQHGDLNPHNVMVSGAGQIKFVDLARIGAWPVGYDLCRLALQVRIRYVDAVRGEDWLFNRLSEWCRDGICLLDGLQDPALSNCPPATECENRLWEYIEGRPKDEQSALLLGARLGALHDLIRVIGYADLSPWKRLWAAISCWNMAKRLGFLSA